MLHKEHKIQVIQRHILYTVGQHRWRKTYRDIQAQTINMWTGNWQTVYCTLLNSIALIPVVLIYVVSVTRSLLCPTEFILPNNRQHDLHFNKRHFACNIQNLEMVVMSTETQQWVAEWEGPEFDLKLLITKIFQNKEQELIELIILIVATLECLCSLCSELKREKCIYKIWLIKLKQM